MSALQLRETFVNETKGYQFSESDWYEPFTEDRGRLFRALQKEYGRCISKMFRESQGSPNRVVGWVFSKKLRYDDARGNDQDRDFYTREVWVEVRES